MKRNCHDFDSPSFKKRKLNTSHKRKLDFSHLHQPFKKLKYSDTEYISLDELRSQSRDYNPSLYYGRNNCPYA